MRTWRTYKPRISMPASGTIRCSTIRIKRWPQKRLLRRKWNGSNQRWQLHDPADIRDPNGPNQLNPQPQLNNPPAFFCVQKMHKITDSNGTWDVVGAYGPIRARLNPIDGGKDHGGYFHGQSNGRGYRHGCMYDGTDTRFADYMWNSMPHAPLTTSADAPVPQP